MNARTYKTIVAISAIFFFLALLVLFFCYKANECHVWVPSGNKFPESEVNGIPEDKPETFEQTAEQCAYEIYNLITEVAEGAS